MVGKVVHFGIGRTDFHAALITRGSLVYRGNVYCQRFFWPLVPLTNWTLELVAVPQAQVALVVNNQSSTKLTGLPGEIMYTSNEMLKELQWNCYQIYRFCFLLFLVSILDVTFQKLLRDVGSPANFALKKDAELKTVDVYLLTVTWWWENEIFLSLTWCHFQPRVTKELFFFP